MITMTMVNAAVLDSLFKPGGTLSPRAAAEELRRLYPNEAMSAAVRRLLEDPHDSHEHRH